MRLTQRIQHLERLEASAHPPSVMERLQSALPEAARRLTGKSADAIRDSAELDLVSSDLQPSFIEKLSDSDLASLVDGLEAITAGSLAAGLPA